MSYCVNCGVKLEASLEECPLCHTPVLNPKEFSHTRPVSPFPRVRGQVDAIKSKDWAVLLSIVLIAVCISCGMLNWLVYDRYLWSLPVIGACIIIWVAAIPAVIYTRLPIYASLLFDGLAVSLYLYLITLMTKTNNKAWFWELGLPITGLATFLVIVFVLLRRKLSASFLTTALYIFAEIPVLCICIELLARRFMGAPKGLSWSAVVLTACVIIVAALGTILSKKRFRNAVRKRLHF